jgi:type I restriction enzyme R subunit
LLQPYAFKCTAASSGNDQLPDLRGASRSHFVAATVDLLTTGVDVPAVVNIVFFRYVKSPIAFYQMVGRGTRLHPPSGKLMFRVFDYTNASRLFGQEFLSRAVRSEGDISKYGLGGAETRSYTPPIQVQGFDVAITDAGQSILTMVDGKAMPVSVEEYKESLAQRLVQHAPTIDLFRQIWIEPSARQELLESLPDGARSALLVRSLDDLEACDLFDVLAHLGYGLAPRTRLERAAAFTYKHEAWLGAMPRKSAETLRAIAMQFGRAGSDGLENPLIFETHEVQRTGGLAALRSLGKPAEVLREMKARIFTA